MKTFYRYVRRYSFRVSNWFVRLALIVWALAGIEYLFRVTPTGWGIVALVAAWGFWIIAEAIKSRPTHFNNITNADCVEISTQSVNYVKSLPTHKEG